MLFKIAYRFGRRSAVKGVDQVEGSCFVEESKKKSKTQNESLSDAGETKVFRCLSKFYQFM